MDKMPVDDFVIAFSTDELVIGYGHGEQCIFRPIFAKIKAGETITMDDLEANSI
jgi:hypothetical protein